MADLNVAIEMIGRDNASGAVDSVVKSLSGISGAADKATGFFGGITAGLGKLGLAGLGIKTLADTVGGFATSMVSGNSEMEKYETQLGTLMGSADGARGRLKELADFGARTPFELPEIAAAEKVLLGFGLTGDKVMKLTGKSASDFREVVGDVAAGTGVSFQEIALTMGKFSSGATGEAISRLQEMGVATREQLADMGVQFSKSGELLSPLPVAMQAITTLAQQKFGGGMEKLSKTFEGQMSTLSDGINQAKIAVMQPIFNVLRDSLARVNELMASGAFQNAIQSIAAFMADLVQKGINLAVEGFNKFSAVVSNLVTAIGPSVQALAERFGAFFSKLSEGSTLAQTVNAAFGDLIPPGLNPILDAVDTGFAKIKETVSGLISAFQQGGLAGVWQQITAAMSEFAPTGERIQSAIAAIGAAISSIIPQPVQDFVSGLLAMGTNAGEGIDPINLLAGAVNTVSAAIQTATQFVKDHVAVQAALVAIMAAGATAWAISAAVQAYQKAIELAGVAVKAYTIVQTALNFVLSANPIGIVVIALAALAAGLVFAYKNSDEFRQVVDTAFDTVRTTVQTAIAAAKIAIETFSAAMTATSTIATSIQESITNSWNTIKSDITSILSTVSNFISTTMGSIQDSFKSTWNSITDSIDSALSTINTSINTIWSDINRFIEATILTIKQTILSFWNQLPDDIQSDLVLIYNHITTQFSSALEYINTHIASVKASISEGWNSIKENIGSVLGEISGNVGSVWDTISKSVSSSIDTIKTAVSTGWSTIQSVISSAMEAISGVISEGWTAIQGTVETAVEAIRGLVEAKWNEIQSVIETVMAAIVVTAANAWEAVRAAIEEKVDAAMAIVRGFGKSLQDFLGGMKDTVFALASSIGNSIVEGIKSGANAVWQSLVDWATQQIRDLLGQMARAVGAKSPSRMAAEMVGVPIMQGITQGIISETPVTVAAARSSATSIVLAFTSLREKFKPNTVVPFGQIRDDIANNTGKIVQDIHNFNGAANNAFKELNGYLQGWIDEAVKHRTELLWRFNFAAYLRGEGNKVLPELKSITENFIRDTTQAAAEAAGKLENIANKLQQDIYDVRNEAMRSADEIVQAAASQVRQIQLQAALQKEIKMQRDSFAKMQQQAKEYFNASQAELQNRLKQQEQIARINYSAGLKLSRVGQAENPEVDRAQKALDAKTELYRIDYEAQRDISRATTEAEKYEIYNRVVAARQALQDQVDEETAIYKATQVERENLQKAQIEAERRNALQGLLDQQNEEMAVRNTTAILRAIISNRETSFDQAQAEQLADFEKSMDDAAFARQVNQIYAERNARLESLEISLEEKEKQIRAASEKERQIVLDGLQQQLKDYKTKYIDGISAAFHHAGIDIADFLDQINNHLAVNVDDTSRRIIDMVQQLNQARQTIGGPYQYIPQQPPLTVAAPNYGTSYIPPVPSATDLNRQVNLAITVNTTVPMTSEDIAREISRSLTLAGL